LLQIQDRDSRLRGLADELNDRVKERTRELSEANKRLEATTKQLVVSEKLAAIGEITAGIAHEINNPMAVIQGNLDVIRQETRKDVELIRTELDLIDEQIHSVTIMVSKLLQFARPDEFSGSVDHQDPKRALEDCLVLVQHLLAKGRIDVVLNNDATGTILINRTELQQVLINLIVNAIHAMPDGGTLTLRTRDSSMNGTEGVVIAVSDTGKGIPEDVVNKIFDPFFTTKEREGTGLGLSITKTIVNRYGGAISVETGTGEGSKFSIWMPVGRKD
jgi:two-component system NtrC family sensor kinase